MFIDLLSRCCGAFIGGLLKGSRTAVSPWIHMQHTVCLFFKIEAKHFGLIVSIETVK
jgi:hypothetical protein